MKVKSRNNKGRYRNYRNPAFYKRAKEYILVNFKSKCNVKADIKENYNKKAKAIFILLKKGLFYEFRTTLVLLFKKSSSHYFLYM